MPESAADDGEDDFDDTGFVSHVHVHVPLPLPPVSSLDKFQAKDEFTGWAKKTRNKIR